MPLPFQNPYRPGAGHMPPYLAGRHQERLDFERLLEQHEILENAVITGLRGVGKTVFLETLKPSALSRGWKWCGADLSETASVSEDNLAERLLTDLAVVTSQLVRRKEREEFGFSRSTRVDEQRIGYADLRERFDQQPGLVSDKLRSVLLYAWDMLRSVEVRGVVFAYDEAQNLSDHSQRDAYPLSVLLDVFQSIQRQGVPFMLVLTGLPTLFPKLVEARTYTERMFRVITLDRLTENESKDAIEKPVEKEACPIRFDDASIELCCRHAGGYPYFIQFYCKETFDVMLQKIGSGENPSVPIDEITRKLDTDFFAGRWSRATDRQRDLMRVIASLETSESEFSVQEIVDRSRALLDKPFSSSHANQMLSALSNRGLVYKNRHGRYLFAVPLLAQYIRRQHP